jgi:hypothetical protein
MDLVVRNMVKHVNLSMAAIAVAVFTVWLMLV